MMLTQSEAAQALRIPVRTWEHLRVSGDGPVYQNWPTLCTGITLTNQCFFFCVSFLIFEREATDGTGMQVGGNGGATAGSR